MSVRSLAVATLLLWSGLVVAGPSASPADPAAPGTTIVGDRESDLGLFLTPWQDDQADRLDPPPSLYRPAAQPLSMQALRQQRDDVRELERYRQQQLR